MGKIWVLDTETKGTGATMVPLEKTLRQPSRRGEPVFTVPELRKREPEAPEPRAPRRFKLVDVVTQEVLAEDADTRATVELLEGRRSVVDVRAYVWEPGPARWRLLRLGELKQLWALRGQLT